jgi:hypothetical protein
MANGIGWGYGDHVAEQVELLEIEVGKHWEHWSDEDRDIVFRCAVVPPQQNG